MSIFDKLLQRWGWIKAKSGSFPPWALATADADASWQPDYSVIAAQTDLYRILSWVHIAVDAVAKAASVVPLNVMQITGEESKDVPNHPFELLLEHPALGTDTSRYELLYNTCAYYSLTGNSYWWLNKASEDAEPEEIWVIPPDMIRPVPDGRMYIKGYLYSPGGAGEEIALEPWEICHFKTFNPRDPWIGQSPIEALAIVSTGDLAMQRWNTKLFAESNGKLPGILAFADPIPDTEWELIKRDTRDKANKRELMMLRNVRAGGVQWIQAAVSQRDMEFLLGRKSNREEIYSMFAPGLYGMLSENATEANAKTAKSTFTDFCVWPMLESMAQKITNAILPAYAENLRAEWEDIRVTDRAMELAEMNAYILTHTIDEVRAKYYEDEPLADITDLEGDKRGLMLVAQISPNTPIEEADEPEPAINPMMPEAPMMEPETEPEEPEEAPGENEGEAEQEAPDADEAIQAEAAKWQRKALKAWRKTGDAQVLFESDIIPAELEAHILNGLREAKSEAEVKAVFADIKAKPEPPQDVTAILEAIRLGVEALRVG